MKATFLCTLLFFICSCCPLEKIYAAFPVKLSQASKTSSVQTLRSGNGISTGVIRLRHRRNNSGLRHLFQSQTEHPETNNSATQGGWAGITSLACALVAITFALTRFFYIGWVFLSVAAIAFGGLGIEKNRKRRRLAYAGLILGNISLITAFIYIVRLTVDSPYFNIAFNFTTFFIPYYLGVYPLLFQSH